MKIIVKSDLNDLQLKEIVNKTLQEADKNNDGLLDFKEFSSVLLIILFILILKIF